MPSQSLPSSAKPAMVSVSRWAQVFFTQSLPRPEGYRLSRTFETTPSNPTLHACSNISPPSTSKLSLNWTSVPSMVFFRCALRSISRSFRKAIEIEEVESDQDDLGGL